MKHGMKYLNHVVQNGTGAVQKRDCEEGGLSRNAEII